MNPRVAIWPVYAVADLTLGARRNRRARVRTIFGTNQADRVTKTMTTARMMTGWKAINRVDAKVRASSERLRAIFENGSGLVLAARRTVAFVPMRAEGNSTTDEEGRDADSGVEVSEGGGGQDGAGGDANEGVNGVPRGIDGGDFVGDELDQVHCAGDGENPGVADAREVAGELHEVEALEQAQGEHGGVEVDSR